MLVGQSPPNKVMALGFSTAPSFPIPASALGGKCVLLVDDEPAYLDLLAQTLADHLVCPVHAFTSPQEALGAAEKLDVGLLVTDFQMPDLNGLELARKLQREKPGLNTVMITGYAIKFSDEELARASSVKVIVKKPFRWEQIAEHISRYWTGSRAPF